MFVYSDYFLQFCPAWPTISLHIHMPTMCPILTMAATVTSNWRWI